MSLKLPLVLAARPCGHEAMLEQQLKQIEELSDTLKALTDKIECLGSSNIRLEIQLEKEKSHRRGQAANAIKQLADYEALSLELDEMHARASRLSEENQRLLLALEKFTQSGQLGSGTVTGNGTK